MSRSPAFAAAVAFAAGVWLASVAWRPPLWWMITILVLAGAGIVVTRSRRVAYASALLAIAALGALDLAGRDASSGRTPELPFDAEQVVVTGHVLRDSSARPRGDMVDIESECITRISTREIEIEPQPSISEMPPVALSTDGPSIYATMKPTPKRARRQHRKTTEQIVGPCEPIAAGIRVNVYPHEISEDEDGESRPSKTDQGGAPTLLYGQRVRFTGRIRLPRNFGNPGAWDYAGYLRNNGIVALASARGDRVELLTGSSGTRMGRWRARVRRSILAKINTLWEARRAGLISAMVIGDTADLRRDVRNDFQRTGVYHILVVSGMNVGILAAVVFWILRRMRVGDLACSVATVALSIGYAFIADAGAPILRATLTLAIYLGARLLYRERAALNAVSVAALLLLVANPRSLFDASFQLTFLSVIAIAGIAVPLLERTTEPYKRALRHLDSLAYDLTLAPRLAQFRLDLRLLQQKLSALLGKPVARFMLLGGTKALLSTAELVTISAIAQFALALPMAVYFHRAVLVGLPANLVVVPLTGILMPAATAAVALAYLSSIASQPAAWLTARSLDWITGTISIVGGWRASEWRIATPSLPVALACGCVLTLCLICVRRARWMAGTAIALLAASAAAVVFLPPKPQLAPGRLEFTAIDVGQADSTLIVTPNGRTLLVDAAGPLGPFQSEFDFGEDVISPYLWSRGITRLDAVAITHAHSDHIGGMASIVRNFRPRELWLGPNAPDRLLETLLSQARTLETDIKEISAPDEFEFGGATFHVLSPPHDWQTASNVRNEDSLVVRIAYHDTSALITGDADKKMEKLILQQDCGAGCPQPAQRVQSTLLHVAHNGSATSTSPEFLDALRPEYAVISVGARNQFRHPRQEVLERLSARGVRTFRTDVNGATSFLLDGENVIPALRDSRPR